MNLATPSLMKTDTTNNASSMYDDTLKNTHLECVHPLATLVKVVHEVHREVCVWLFVFVCRASRNLSPEVEQHYTLNQ
jgi:hypothetical protein